MGKSRILVVGATGNLGHHLVNASLAYDHPTFALVRDSTFSDPHKSHLINSLIESGVHLIKALQKFFFFVKPSLLESSKQKSYLSFICSLLFSGIVARSSNSDWSHQTSWCRDLRRFFESGPWSEAPDSSNQRSWMHQGMIFASYTLELSLLNWCNYFQMVEEVHSIRIWSWSWQSSDFWSCPKLLFEQSGDPAYHREGRHSLHLYILQPFCRVFTSITCAARA